MMKLLFDAVDREALTRPQADPSHAIADRDAKLVRAFEHASLDDPAAMAQPHRPLERRRERRPALCGLRAPQRRNEQCRLPRLACHQRTADRVAAVGKKWNLRIASAKHRIAQAFDQQAAIRRDAEHDGVLERGDEAIDRLLARGRVRDQLAEHRVVVRCDRCAVAQRVIEADAARCDEAANDAGVRRERFVFGAQPNLDRMTGPTHFVLRHRQRLAARDPKLPRDEVESGDRFRHRVLDLQPRVHLHQKEFGFPITLSLSKGEQKLDCPCADVAGCLRKTRRTVAHALSQVRVDSGARRLFDDLLVPALHRAVALAEMDAVTLRVGEHLDLDMAGREQRAFEQQLAVAERCARFGARTAQRGHQLIVAAHEAHATTTTTGGSLDHQRETDARGLADEARLGLIVAGIARQTRHAQLSGESLDG